MSDGENFTELLERVDREEPGALSELFKLAYDELRDEASRRLRCRGWFDSLETTMLVNETYLRLSHKAQLGCKGRRHFYFVAARAMHDVVVERARARDTLKRGRNRHRVSMEVEDLARPDPVSHILAVSDAMEALRTHDEPSADVMFLHFFGGLSFQRIAEVTDCTASAVRRNFKYAKAWLRQHFETHGRTG